MNPVKASQRRARDAAGSVKADIDRHIASRSLGLYQTSFNKDGVVENYARDDMYYFVCRTRRRR